MKLRASPIVDKWGRQHEAPVPPPWFTDAVELYARESGRHASTKWEQAMGCFVSHLSRMANDPVLARHPDNAGEPIYWHEWKEKSRPHPLIGPSVMVGGWRPLDIEQLGVEGTLRKLRSENTWSGRGDYSSHDESVDAILARTFAREMAQQKKLRDGLEGPLKATIRHNRGHALGTVPDNITP